MSREDHARDNLAWCSRNPGPLQSTALTNEERNGIAQSIAKELADLTATGKVGNLLLPQELHEFVKCKVETGEFGSPTEFLSAAMPFLRARQGNSARAEIFDEYR